MSGYPDRRRTPWAVAIRLIGRTDVLTLRSCWSALVSVPVLRGDTSAPSPPHRLAAERSDDQDHAREAPHRKFHVSSLVCGPRRYGIWCTHRRPTHACARLNQTRTEWPSRALLPRPTGGPDDGTRVPPLSPVVGAPCLCFPVPLFRCSAVRLLRCLAASMGRRGAWPVCLAGDLDGPSWLPGHNLDGPFPRQRLRLPTGNMRRT